MASEPGTTLTEAEKAMQWERMSGERLPDADRQRVMDGEKFVPPHMRPETTHPERGDLDKMTKKPQSVQRELEEARRIVNRVIIPPAEEPDHAAPETARLPFGELPILEAYDRMREIIREYVDPIAVRPEDAADVEAMQKDD